MKASMIALFFAVFGLLNVPAQAQSGADELQYRWNAHGFFAAGGTMSETGASITGGGGGVEGFVWKRVTAGADVSVFHDNYYTKIGNFGHVGGQVGYHFASREKTRGADPFVVFGIGGYFP